jgi:ubiquitin-conjugating enzyme E2 Q
MEALPDGSRSVGKAKKTKTSIPFVVLDPAHQITLQSKRLEVPTPGYMIDALVELRKNEAVDEDHDEMDEHIFSYVAEVPAPTANSNSAYKGPIVLSDDDDEPMPAPSKGKGKARALVSTASAILKGKGGSSSKAPKKGPPKDDWQHNEAYVLRAIERLMPPPFESTPSSTHAVQRELKAMLKEQAEAMVSEAGLKGLGWYMSEDLMGDNLFQWILELHSFDETLPIAKDLKAKYVWVLSFLIRAAADVYGAGA